MPLRWPGTGESLSLLGLQRSAGPGRPTGDDVHGWSMSSAPAISVSSPVPTVNILRTLWMLLSNLVGHVSWSGLSRG